jgi:diacylglycerol kinase (ATP)
VIAAGRTRDIDLGRTDRGVWWGGVLNAGFDSQVVARAERMRRPHGPLRYDLAAYREIADLRLHRMRITLDGVSREETVTLVAVGNSSRYGGGMRIAPGAELDDGLFDVGGRRGHDPPHAGPAQALVRAGTHVRHAPGPGAPGGVGDAERARPAGVRGRRGRSARCRSPPPACGGYCGCSCPEPSRTVGP